MTRVHSRIFLSLILLLGLSALTAFATYRFWCQIASPAHLDINTPATEILYLVTPGSSVRRIAEELEQQKIVRSAYAIRILARWQGNANRMQVGEYELSASMSPEEILHKIASGKVKLYAVTIAEGLTAQEIALRLEDTGLVNAVEFLQYAMSPQAAADCGVEGVSLEGYLFPDTYHFPRGVSVPKIASTLVAEFNKVWEKIEPEATRTRYSMLEVVTLASIIEKETGTASERPLIASVFLNRMEIGMRLQSDPTVIYGIPNFDGNLRRKQLDDATNLYNTYQIRGLPPGPIANPGAESLRAVVRPAQTKYLYFVARNDGSHYFSATYREHVNAVNLFQRRKR